jgi:hypothetical protein
VYYTEAIRKAARRADAAAWEAISAYQDDTVPYEENITAGLALLLRNALNGQIEGLSWSSHVMRTAGRDHAEESLTGADLVIHVSFASPELTYSKGVLVQAKRVEPDVLMAPQHYNDLMIQCQKMLARTASSFVFDYAYTGMRCGAASAIIGSNNRYLHDQCVWTPYRFFLELFRCPIGDPSITSTKVEELPVPNKLFLSASGDGRSRL